MNPEDEIQNITDQNGSEEVQTSSTASEIDTVKQENANLQQKVFQLMADFENFRKRSETDKTKYALVGNMMLISHISEIGDDIQLSLNDDSLDVEGAKQMLKTVQDKLIQALQAGGLIKIEVNKGDKFDAATMEAITTIPNSDDSEPNTVADVISAGYRHQQTDEVIKTAKVVVFK